MADTVAVIIGVGADNGMGGQLCHRFAGQGMHVVIAGRTQEKIDKVADAIRSRGGKASAIACDATKEADVVKLFEEAGGIGPIDLAIYNAGNNMPGHLIGMEAAYFEECWRVCTFGGFLFAREAATYMEKKGRGTILFTGATASRVGNPMFVAFTAAKAGLRTMAQAMAKDLQPKGIHIGHVVIDGAIDGELIRTRLPQLVEAWGEDRLVDLAGIIDIYEMLYKQPKRAWSFEVDVRAYPAEFGV